MRKQIAKWLYNRYRSEFQEVMVEDTFVTTIPKTVTDNAILFLSKNRKFLEPWIVFQSYTMQRRFVAVDKRNADVWLGCLFMLKVLYLAIARGPVIGEGEERLQDIPAKKEPDKPADVDDFVARMKEFRDKPKTSEE